MSKVHRRQKSQSASFHRITAKGVSRRHRSRKHFYATNNSNEMLFLFDSIQIEHTDLAYEAERQFISRTKTVGQDTETRS